MSVNFEDYLVEEAGVPSAGTAYTLTYIAPTAGTPYVQFTIINQGSTRETTTWKVYADTLVQVINSSTI